MFSHLSRTNSFDYAFYLLKQIGENIRTLCFRRFSQDIRLFHSFVLRTAHNQVWIFTDNLRNASLGIFFTSRFLWLLPIILIQYNLLIDWAYELIELRKLFFPFDLFPLVILTIRHWPCLLLVINFRGNRGYVTSYVDNTIRIGRIGRLAMDSLGSIRFLALREYAPNDAWNVHSLDINRSVGRKDV